MVKITNHKNSHSEISISGFEEGGSVCINELTEEQQSYLCPFGTSDFQ